MYLTKLHVVTHYGPSENLSEKVQGASLVPILSTATYDHEMSSGSLASVFNMPQGGHFYQVHAIMHGFVMNV